MSQDILTESNNLNSDEQVDTVTSSPKRRLRKYSYQQAQIQGAANTETLTQQTPMAATLPEIQENEEESSLLNSKKLLAKEDFHKKNTSQKLDSVAEALNRLSEMMHKVDSDLQHRIKPLESVIFDIDEGVVPQFAN